MKNVADPLASLAVTAWVGSLLAIGYLAVPTLFYAQPDRQLAGMLAGRMFVSVSYLSLVCGLYLLIYFRSQPNRNSRQLFWIVLSMLLINLIIQYGIQPAMNELKAQALPLDVMHSAFSSKFKMMHGISSIAYMIESLLGIFLAIKNRKP